MSDRPEHQEILGRIDALAIAVHRGFERVDSRLNGLEAEVREVRSEVAEVRSGLAEVRSGLATLTIDMREVKEEVRG